MESKRGNQAGPRRLGLTGGVGSGKSTVARLLARHGLPVVDTDALTHELLDDSRGAAFAAVVARFGNQVVGADGTIDRAALAQQVFRDPQARLDLEAILHPAIAAEVEERIAALPAGTGWVVLEVPLLFEAGWDARVDLVAVVDCPPATQVARFVKRTGASEADGWARVKSQMPRAERLARADVVVDNSSSLERLEKEIEELLAKLQESGGKDGV